MRYEPPGYGPSWWDENKPDCFKDYEELSCKFKVMFIMLSIILVGGGTLGCIIAAGGLNVSGKATSIKDSTGQIPISDNSK